MTLLSKECLTRSTHTVRYNSVARVYEVERVNNGNYRVICCYRTKALADSLAAHMNALDESAPD